MRIATIMGSPRLKGNTSTTLGWAEAELRAAGHEVDRINIVDHRVKGCKGCYACKRVDDEPGCPQKDDTLSLFERMTRADALVYASPLYCWDFTSQMKALIDRHICLVSGFGGANHRSLLEGKRAALLVTCEDQVEGNADLIQIVFDRAGYYLKFKVTGKYVVTYCTNPDELGDEAKAAAKRLAEELAG